MAYYLQMDGVDDYLRSAPSVAIDRVVMDIELDPTQTSIYGYLFDERSTGTAYAYISKDGDAVTLPSGVTVLVDGVSSANITKGARHTIQFSFVTASADANGIELFANNTLSAGRFAKGKIFRITASNSGTTVFDYDMSTGTVQDQSGNGKHGTLTGGTWVSDAPPPAGGTQGSVSYVTKQTIYQSGSAAVATKQTISQTGSVAYDTRQTIADGGIVGAVRYATKQTIYNQTWVRYATKQSIYQVVAVSCPTRQSIMDFAEIVGKIKLQGELNAPMKLLGTFNTTVKWQGEINPPTVKWAGEL